MLRWLLVLVVALPALAVSVGRAEGTTVFVLYREPKLAVAVFGAWVLFAALAWFRPQVLSARELLRTARRPAVALGLVLGAWLALTGLWGVVVENYRYEIAQYLTFGLLLVLLATWTRLDSGVPRRIEIGLVASLGVVTVVGVWQWLGWPLPLELPPIRPEMGALHPSLMGYKNPAAMAVAGQLFLVAGLALRCRHRGVRACLAMMVAVETAYVLSLGSRTVVLALTAGLVYLGILTWIATRTDAEPSERKHLRSMVIVLTLFLLALGALAASNLGIRERLGTMVDFARAPATYLDSDRGIYLRNTLQMARHEPLGIGLGDWQTAYPVFRLHGRSVSFDRDYEVRRAHSDHVQMLGEAGWPGLFLWFAWLAALAVKPARAYLAGRDPSHLLASVQIVALSVAMATDYVVELPYGKFQLFLVASLALVSGEAEHPGPEGSPGGFRPVVAVPVAGFALLVILMMAAHLQKVQVAAEISRRYEQEIGELARAGRVERVGLEQILALGHRFRQLPGGDKTTYRTYLALAHFADLLGKHEAALADTTRALELHPFSVDALGLMARVAPPRCAEVWLRARSLVMDRATSGLSEPYPRCGLQASSTRN